MEPFESPSALRVPYEFRPAKQVERRMLLDALQRLMAGGFDLRSYQYTGMGSLYFVDFILLHKFLGISRLWCVERDRSLYARLEFNKPSRLIRVIPEAIGDVIGELDRSQRHLVWMDYDQRLDQTIAEDFRLAVASVPNSSIVLITVDAKSPELDLSAQEPKGPLAPHWRSYYERHVGPYFDHDWTDEHFTEDMVTATLAKILFNIARAAALPDFEFLPLFNFTYADGHPMVTVGGMVGREAERTMIARCDFSDSDYVRRAGFDRQYRIEVPRLTRKEKLYLDSYMPCEENWRPAELEMRVEDIHHYRAIYRFYPTYVEMLL